MTVLAEESRLTLVASNTSWVNPPEFPKKKVPGVGVYTAVMAWGPDVRAVVEHWAVIADTGTDAHRVTTPSMKATVPSTVPELTNVALKVTFSPKALGLLLVATFMFVANLTSKVNAGVEVLSAKIAGGATVSSVYAAVKE